MTFSYAWAGLSQEGHNEVKWSALLFKGHLYLSVPNGLVVERSKEAFVTLLEFAEEQLDCSAIVVYFAKNRPERQCLMRIFMFLGFAVLPPKHSLIPIDASEETLYMAYELM